jgi:hypothetical protein
MSAITEARRDLQRRARERQSDVLPQLRAAVKARRKAKTKRLAKCRTDCKRRKERVQRNAVKAREKLREKIRQTKEVARQACTLCKVTATEQELDKLDRALANVEAERAAIRELRMRAARTVDPRGRAGGMRAQELRRESEEEVRRNIEDDADLLALWDSVDRNKFKQTQRRTRTESFLDWVHNHPEALAELRHSQQEQWDREAEDLFKQWPREEPIGRMTDAQLNELLQDLDRAEAVAAEVPF